MWPQAIYEELSGQRLTSILMHAARDEVTPLDNLRFSRIPFGALAQAFERHILPKHSALRYLHSRDVDTDFYKKTDLDTLGWCKFCGSACCLRHQRLAVR